MSARGHLGGLATASPMAVRVLEGAGFDVILLETVGVGQSELDVVKVADTVVVIAVPGLGDAVQTLKAGILEVADLFVVNMADRPGAVRTAAELLAMLQLGADRDNAWTPPIVETVAVEGRGLDELWQTLERHRAHLDATGELGARRGRRIETEVLELVDRELRLGLRQQVAAGGVIAQLLADARAGRLDPHTASAQIMACYRRPGQSTGAGQTKETYDAAAAIPGDHADGRRERRGG
jgi:LAO/AO transport system kinase